MATEKAKGSLISFEGIDFCGKTTQVLLLQEHLIAKGHQVVVVREPGGTEISEKIREILLDKENLHMEPTSEMLLYQASRAQLTGEVILPALKEGKTVLCDRYYDSTTAYQGYGRGLDLELVEKVNQLATSSFLPEADPPRAGRPDLTFILDISPEEAFARVESSKLVRDRMEDQRISFYKKVRDGYLTMAKSEPDRFRVIPASGTIEAIASLIADEVDKLIQKSGHRR
jgi:dTMP kinase